MANGWFKSHMYKNHVGLIGFIGSYPESRRLENGTQLTSLSLATKTSWKNEAGTYDSRTDRHRIVVWGKLAQFASTLSSGSHIEIEGQFRHRTYRKQVHIGEKTLTVDTTVTEIHASVIRKLDRNGSPRMPPKNTYLKRRPNRAPSVHCNIDRSVYLIVFDNISIAAFLMKSSELCRTVRYQGEENALTRTVQIDSPILGLQVLTQEKKAYIVRPNTSQPPKYVLVFAINLSVPFEAMA